MTALLYDIAGGGMVPSHGPEGWMGWIRRVRVCMGEMECRNGVGWGKEIAHTAHKVTLRAQRSR